MNLYPSEIISVLDGVVCASIMLAVLFHKRPENCQFNRLLATAAIFILIGCFSEVLETIEGEKKCWSSLLFHCGILITVIYSSGSLGSGFRNLVRMSSKPSKELL